MSDFLDIQQPVMDIQKGRSSGSFVSDAPRWFIVVIGLAYATGYLVVSTYLDSFGVHSVTSDLVRLKYLQVGFFFLLFFGSIIVLFVSTRKGLQLQKLAIEGNIQAKKDEIKAAETKVERGGSNEQPRAELEQLGSELKCLQKQLELVPLFEIIVGIWIDVIVFIYLVLGFAPPEASSQVLPWVTALLLVATLGSTRINWLARKYAARNADLPRLITRLWQVLLVILVPIDIFVVLPFFGRLTLLFVQQWPVLLAFLALMSMLWFLADRGANQREHIGDEEHKAYMWARVALGLPVYYLSVLTFAYGIYPYMPSPKGGGYYPDAALIKLTTKGAEALPESLRDTCETPHPGAPGRGASDKSRAKATSPMPTQSATATIQTQSKELVLIEENPSTVFLADPVDPPYRRRKGSECWTRYNCRPKVYAIQSSNIINIERIPRTPSKARQAKSDCR